MNAALHDLLLSHDSGFGAFHSVHAVRVGILDEGETERSPAVLIASELGDGSLSIVVGAEFDHTSASRAAIWFILNLRSLDLANSREQLDEVFVAGGPRKLYSLATVNVDTRT